MTLGNDETTLRRQDVARLFAEAGESSPPLTEGTLLNGYTLVERLGRGGMGEVWRASRGSEQVAIKVLLRGLLEDEQSRARFEREARSLASLGDLPGIVRLLGVGATEMGRPYFVMEYVAGARPFSEVLDAGVSRETALDVLEQVGRALGVAHARGLLHRDVKPSNILFLPDGSCRLIDFGLVKAIGGESQRLTQSDEIIGTAAYMAPEMIRGEAYGPPMDVFALGATLYKVLTGVTPYTGNMIELLDRIASDSPFARPSEIARDPVPAPIEAVCLRALAHTPARRYADGAEFAAALAEARRSSQGERAGRGAVALGVGAALVIVGLVGVVLSQGRPGGGGAPELTLAPQPEATRDEAPVGSTSPSLAPLPEWFTALPSRARPPLPLPSGLRFGEASGEYQARDGSRLVWCPPGRFWMGSEDGNPDERPVRKVDVSGFFVGKVEVTWGQYRRFCKRTGRAPPSNRIDDYSVPFAAGERHPVFRVDWGDARAYCTWAGLRLPSEVEWEYAARGTDRARRYPWGRHLPRKGEPVANLADKSVVGFVKPGWGKFEADYDDGSFFPTPVGRYPHGASVFGCLDMAGNVWEWTATRYSPYGAQPGPTERFRIARGGSWDNSASYCRSTNRGRMDPDAKQNFLGFRVALSPSR